MTKKSVFCLATSRTQAEIIVGELQAEDFSNQEISALFADRDATRDAVHGRGPYASEGNLASGAIGGALGWIAGIGALTVPGAGPLIAAGPIVAILSGAGVGAGGGIAGSLIALGLPEPDARRYEGKIKLGNLLIAVHTDRPDQAAEAKEIFANAGAQDIGVSAESAAIRLDRPKAAVRESSVKYHAGV